MEKKGQKKLDGAGRRRALLALVHIAKKDLGLDDELYHDILMDEFTETSAANLSDAELSRLLERFEEHGWVARSARRKAKGYRQKSEAQADALKERVGQELLHTDFDEKRLRGLVRKICGVDDLQWCGDAVRLKRLLAVIHDMIEKGSIAQSV